MKYRIYVLNVFWIIMLISISCSEANKPIIPSKIETSLHQKANAYISPLPSFDIDNKSDLEVLRINLGKKLFLDSLLSFNQTQNCSTCHILDKYGVDNKRVSEGDNGRTGTRNTPTIYNASLQFAQFWDAHVKTIEEQASGPLFGTDEMGLPDTTFLINRLKNESNYLVLFDLAYPDKDTTITIETIVNSLGEFQKTLITSGDRFDKYLKGDYNAISQQEKSGLNLFIDKGCIPCHSGSLIGGNMEQKFSIYGYYWDYTGSTFFDKGKYKHTKEDNDKFVFKVPSLRNVTMTYPYFHDGSVDNLAKAIQIMAQSELNTTLTEEEVEDIEAFLGSLTGEIPNIDFKRN